jgi:hypothetical protein
LEAGYFKGDLPISQVAGGPFYPLSAWFPDLHYAFRPNPTNGKDGNQEAKGRAEAAEKERLRQEVEQKRLAAEEAQRAAEEAARRDAQEREAAARELELQKQAKAKETNDSSGINDSSNQLKMMLGLSAGAQAAHDDGVEQMENFIPSMHTRSNEKRGKPTNTKASQNDTAEAQDPATVHLPGAAAPAWGGVASNKQTRKSMSEIQQEEARAAAMLAAKRGSVPQPSSGWANVAAGTSGWSSGAMRPTYNVQNPTIVTSVRPSQARPNQPPAVAQGVASRKVAPINHQQRSSSTASSTPAEEFGTSMSPTLEKWCKEKMVQINGVDDLTLVGFCMTLNDANEIRQYLTTYLGNTPQVNNFATEFINKRGLGKKQEEWETPGSAKKGRKKKPGR